MFRSTAHILLHFIVPAAVARRWFSEKWKYSYAIMLATMVVDTDHLLAEPIYEPDRCSVGFHPLHTWGPIAIYIAMCFHPKTRLAGIGLVIHMLLDSFDCAWMALLG